MNYFLAVEVPEDVQQQIARQVNQWKHEQANEYPSQWTNPVDYHITLMFLGLLTDNGIATAIAETTRVAETSEPFHITLAQVGSFGRMRGASSVLWMGVRRNEALSKLAQDLSGCVAYASVLSDRFLHNVNSSDQPYKPHVTLARCTTRPEDEGDAFDYEHPFPNWRVEQFVLMQTRASEIRTNSMKRRYNIVHTFPLGDTHLSAAR